MIKFGSLLLSLAILIVPLTAQASEQDELGGPEAFEVIKVKNWVNLRNEPTRKSPTFARVPRGAIVVHLGETLSAVDGPWFQVQYGVYIGYLRGDFLKALGPYGSGDTIKPPIYAPDLSKKTNATSCGGLVREGTSLETAIRGSFPEYTRVKVLEATDQWTGDYQWFKVAFKGGTAYQWGGIMSVDGPVQGSFMGC